MGTWLVFGSNFGYLYFEIIRTKSGKFHVFSAFDEEGELNLHYVLDVVSHQVARQEACRAEETGHRSAAGCYLDSYCLGLDSLAILVSAYRVNISPDMSSKHNDCHRPG